MNEQQRPVALITGAAKRVGAQIARSLHGAGYDLALHYRHSRGEMDALCAELNMARNGSAQAIQAELADVEVMPRIVEACITRFGRLDALVNNASAFYATPVGSVTPTQWEELFASNARAPFFLAQAAAPHLQAAHGAIVNMADIYAERPLPGHAVYCMAKAALVMMTLALAKELGPKVRVNAIAPGAVLWPESGKAYADQKELVARTPLKRAGSPEDVAAAVLFLLRDAKFTTGQILKVDGGRALAI
ncbi:MAG: pteridine reductase [Xanthomonadales bacterium PRO7]|nr:pteridine reductase [Xanthomonadales bacterium PRO7]